MIYNIISSMIPALDTDRHETAWHHYWERGVARRVLPVGLAALLVAGGLPAQAQWTDFAAYGQRTLQFMKDNAHKIEQKLRWAEEKLQVQSDLFRSAALTYATARQAQAAWGRTAQANISLSFVSALPTIDVFQNQVGQTEHVRIRPVFRAKDRNPKFSPQIQNPFQGIDWRNLDLDVDRSVVRAKNPDKGKSLQQIQQEALADGLESWRLSQEIAGVDALAQDLPDSPNPYRALTEEEAQHRKERAQRLQSYMLACLRSYGEASPQYTEAKASYQRWVRESSSGVGEERAKRAVEALQRLDAEAAGLVETFGVQSAGLRNLTLQAEATHENIKEIAEKHDSKPGVIASYMDYLGWTSVLDTAMAIGGKGNQAQVASVKEQHGNQLKQTVLQQQSALVAEEAAKQEARARLEETQRRMKGLAAQKAALLQRLRTAQGAEKFADDVAALRLQTDQALEALAIRSFAAYLPGSLVPVVPDEVARRLQGQGVVAATDGLGALQSQVAKGVEEATAQAQREVGEALRDLPKRLSGGVLEPLLGGIADGTKALLGNPFDLRNLGASNAPLIHKRLG